jgi:hypothetical protein
LPPNKEKHNPSERKQRTKEENNQRKGQSTALNMIKGKFCRDNLFVVNWHIIVRRSLPPNKEKHNPSERKQRGRKESEERPKHLLMFVRLKLCWMLLRDEHLGKGWI